MGSILNSWLDDSSAPDSCSRSAANLNKSLKITGLIHKGIVNRVNRTSKDDGH